MEEEILRVMSFTHVKKVNLTHYMSTFIRTEYDKRKLLGSIKNFTHLRRAYVQEGDHIVTFLEKV